MTKNKEKFKPLKAICSNWNTYTASKNSINWRSQAEKKQELKSWDLKQIVNGLKGSKNQEAAMGYLQKVVNNLTETVSEKEIELESQKFINK